MAWPLRPSSKRRGTSWTNYGFLLLIVLAGAYMGFRVPRGHAMYATAVEHMSTNPHAGLIDDQQQQQQARREAVTVVPGDAAAATQKAGGAVAAVVVGAVRGLAAGSSGATTGAAAAAAAGAAAGGAPVPRILHQMHANYSRLSPTQRMLVEKCREMHEKSGWRVIFWNDSAVDTFIKMQYAEHYTWWLEMEPPIKRIDTSRYFLMHHYGGVYIDVDVECVTDMSSMVDALVPGAVHVGDFPEPMFLSSAPGARLWPFALKRIRRVWREKDAWHTAGPAGLNDAIHEWIQHMGSGVLVPWLTRRAEPDFHEFTKHKAGKILYFELSNADWGLEDAKQQEAIWRSRDYGVGRIAASRFPRSNTTLAPEYGVGFIANELLDPVSCSNSALAHCVESWCNATWPLTYVVHHCMSTWRGRIGTR